MYKATYRLGRRGLVISAISGVDTALWDLLGKELGAPVYKLLGADRRPIKGYITGGYYREDKDIKKLVEEEKSYVQAGFDTVKIKIGGLSIKEDLERVFAVREDLGTQVNIACRSEEHTSELQSRQYLVCRLLLEKKTKRIQR